MAPRAWQPVNLVQMPAGRRGFPPIGGLGAILSCLLFPTATPASVGDKPPPSLSPIYGETLASSFMDPSIYISGLCAENAYRLGRRLASRGADLSLVNVVYVLREFRKTRPVPAYVDPGVFYPSHFRSSHPSWPFHVFLTVDRPRGGPMVLDLDYGKSAVTASSYFNRTFPPDHSDPRSDRLSHVFLRVIPWAEYEEMFRTRSVHEVARHYRFSDLPGHPVISARQYLRSASSGRPGVAPRGATSSGRRRLNLADLKRCLLHALGL